MLLPSTRAAEECAICLAELSASRPTGLFKRFLTNDVFTSNRVTRLPCGHIFHSNCFNGWLNHGGRICPFCRLPIPATTSQKLQTAVNLIKNVLYEFREELPGMSRALNGIIVSLVGWYRLVESTRLDKIDQLDPVLSRLTTWAIFAYATFLAGSSSLIVRRGDFANQADEIQAYRSYFKPFLISAGCLGGAAMCGLIYREFALYHRHNDMVLFPLVISLKIGWIWFFSNLTLHGLSL
jgi:hypothetical protein